MQYLYVDRVKNNSTRPVLRMLPAYVPWTDGLLRERQTNELDSNAFGTGEILKWDEGDIVYDLKLILCSDK